MYKLLFLGIATVVGMIVAPMIAGQQGYAMIEFLGYRYEMSVTVLIIGMLLLFFMIYLFISLLYFIFTAPFALGRWFKITDPKRKLKQLERAEKAQVSGNQQQAASLFLQYGKRYHAYFAYLNAALALIQMRKMDEAKSALDEAAKRIPKKDHFSFRLVQLRYLIESRDYDNATILAKKLFNEQPRNSTVIALSYQLYELSQNDDEMMDIFIAMEKIKLFSEERLEAIKKATYRHKLQELMTYSGAEAVTQWWDEQPRALRKDPELLALYQECLAPKITESL